MALGDPEDEIASVVSAADLCPTANLFLRLLKTCNGRMLRRPIPSARSLAPDNVLTRSRCQIALPHGGFEGVRACTGEPAELSDSKSTQRRGTHEHNHQALHRWSVR